LRHISQWEGAARAHGEVCAELEPVSTFIEASGFLHPDILVEVEASAVLERTTR
jgi:hypothetical protein